MIFLTEEKPFLAKAIWTSTSEATAFALKQVSLINDLNGSEGAEEQKGNSQETTGQAWGTALHVTTYLCVLQALRLPPSWRMERCRQPS